MSKFLHNDDEFLPTKDNAKAISIPQVSPKTAELKIIANKLIIWQVEILSTCKKMPVGKKSKSSPKFMDRQAETAHTLLLYRLLSPTLNMSMAYFEELYGSFLK